MSYRIHFGRSKQWRINSRSNNPDGYFRCRVFWSLSAAILILQKLCWDYAQKAVFWTWISMDGLAKPCNGRLKHRRETFIIFCAGTLICHHKSLIFHWGSRDYRLMLWQLSFCMYQQETDVGMKIFLFSIHSNVHFCSFFFCITGVLECDAGD